MEVRRRMWWGVEGERIGSRDEGGKGGRKRGQEGYGGRDVGRRKNNSNWGGCEHTCR